MTQTSPFDRRRSRARRPTGLLAAGLLLVLAPAHGDAQPAPLVFEYVYPYNTPDLTENHVIVVDTAGAVPRGWYYGTSDEFDRAREGYLPGFFVAPMSNLTLSPATIAFTLTRPEGFFTSPVPLEYRDANAAAAAMTAWDVPLPVASRVYDGTIEDDRITLDLPEGPRVFQKR